MTLVVSFNWFSEVVAVADTRVAWPGNQIPPNDVLRKLYSLTNSNKSILLGFSGDLWAAKEVLTYIIHKKLSNYKRDFVIKQFRDELRGWIEEVATSTLTSRERRGLKFILCGVEPSRHPPLLQHGRFVRPSPFVESHIYVYSIRNTTGQVVVNEKSQHIGIIGSGKALKREIAQAITQDIHFGFRQKNLHWARANLVARDIAAIALRDKSISPHVGGPFQVVRITPEGLQEQYIWPPIGGLQNVGVLSNGSRRVVYNSGSGEAYELVPVWELAFNRKPF